MVQIKIKAINEQYHVYCTYDDFNLFLLSLSERLEKLHRGEHTFEAYFYVSCEISDQQLLEMMRCVHTANALMLGISSGETKEKKMMVIKENLHRGQTYTFDQEVILLGSIDAFAFVESSENIYCIGNVSGNIDLLHEDCSISGASFQQANIRICDSNYHNLTSFSPSKVYYNTRDILCDAYEEERLWVVQ